MDDLLTGLGIVLVLVVSAWHVGSPLLRAAAFCCYKASPRHRARCTAY
jgi:hypothetical protein